MAQAEATADEAAQEASFEAAAKLEAQIEQLQVANYFLQKRHVSDTDAVASCLMLANIQILATSFFFY